MEESMYPNTAGQMETGLLFPATISGNTGMPLELLTRSAGILSSLQCRGAIQYAPMYSSISYPKIILTIKFFLFVTEPPGTSPKAWSSLPISIWLLFPPYTPEMNPIEQVWKEIRTRGFKNEVFKTLEGVVDRLYKTVKDLSSETIKSITGRKWIIELF